MSVLPVLAAMLATSLSARTFAEEAVVVNTRALPAGSSSTLLVRAFAGSSEFTSTIDGATVSIDRRAAGTTPYSLSSVDAGTWLVGVAAKGYRPEELRLSVTDGIAYEVIFHLQRAVGLLSVGVSPPQAELLVDGETRRPGLLTLPTGYHNLSARLFGYESVSTTALVPDRGIGVAELVLRPALFAVTDFAATRRTMNPANAGPFGRNELSFRVTGPGSARLSILDANGDEVFSKDFGQLETWNQSVAWTGRDQSGTPLPDGSYEARLSATSPNGIVTAKDLEIELDSSLVARPFGATGGLAGLALLPLPSSSPALLGAADAGIASGITPFSPSVRMGIRAAAPDFGVGVEAQGSLSGWDSFRLGFELPLRGWVPGFGAAFGLNYGLDDTLLFRSVLVLPLFSDLASAPAARPAFFAGVAPGLGIAWALSSGNPQLRPDVSAGIALASDRLVAGLSLRGTAADLLAGQLAFGGLAVAAEGRYLLPSTPFTVSVAAIEYFSAKLVPLATEISCGLGLWF